MQRGAYAYEFAAHLESPDQLKLLPGQVIYVVLQRCEVAAPGRQSPIGQAVSQGCMGTQTYRAKAVKPKRGKHGKGSRGGGRGAGEDWKERWEGNGGQERGRERGEGKEHGEGGANRGKERVGRIGLQGRGRGEERGNDNGVLICISREVAKR